MPVQHTTGGYETRILVVDDDPFTRKIVRRVLTELRYGAVTDADCAESALALLRGKSFDLLITDVQMPDMNGLELVRRIRTGLAGAARDIRIIVLTSFSNTEVLGAALALDVNGFLVKPIKPVTVQEKIVQAMGEHATLKPDIGYQSVNTDLRTVRVEQAAPETSNAVASAGELQGGGYVARRRVALLHLQPGMELRQHVTTSDGTLLLTPGHVLSQLNINRLHDLRGILRDDAYWVAEGRAESGVQ